MKRHNVLGMAVGCFLAAFKNGDLGPRMLGMSHENEVKYLANDVLGVAPESVKNWMQEFIPYWAKSRRGDVYQGWAPSSLTGRPRNEGESRESRVRMFAYFELMPDQEMVEVCKAILDLCDNPKYDRKFIDNFSNAYLGKSEKQTVFTSAEVAMRAVSNDLPKIIKKPSGNQKPEKRRAGVAGYVYARDLEVVSWALERSNGYCELCTNLGPFETFEGKRFLEVHHITPLYVGGPDTTENVAALCPNCHRACHFANNKSELSLKLINKFSKSPLE